jgi:hypothetical protein
MEEAGGFTGVAVGSTWEAAEASAAVMAPLADTAAGDGPTRARRWDEAHTDGPEDSPVLMGGATDTVPAATARAQ